MHSHTPYSFPKLYTMYSEISLLYSIEICYFLSWLQFSDFRTHYWVMTHTLKFSIIKNKKQGHK